LLADIALNCLQIYVSPSELIQQLFLFGLKLLSFHGSSETSGTLLVHFCSRSNTINGKIEEFTRTYDIHNFINIIVNVSALLLKIVRFFDVLTFGVACGVNKSIHIDVEIIDVGVR